jgi:hypothetical protein
LAVVVATTAQNLQSLFREATIHNGVGGKLYDGLLEADPTKNWL